VRARAVDYISNEGAPGLTPAALSAALARVHLGGLPERGADGRVLTLRGVGFEARRPLPAPRPGDRAPAAASGEALGAPSHWECAGRRGSPACA